MKHSKAEIIGVVTQPNATLPNKIQRIPRPPLAMPMPMTAPMTACELDTGTSGSDG